MEILKKEITDQIRENYKNVRNRLIYEFDRTRQTIDNWADENDKGYPTLLLTPMGLRAIAEELELKKSELLTEF